ncbi:MAG: 30S ribosomal protein S19e [Candidatus Woesearchaeota archaeon]|nr:30S ribosomal protein S19e [Candidatus Woesearchaeota archaeon]
MTILQDVNVNDHIEKLAEELKKIKTISPPEWAAFVKTGVSKERPPVRADWWYFRAAAVLKAVERLGPVGVSKLKTKYGGKKNRGHQPSKFFRASGNILRKVLQQLEKSGLVKQQEKSKDKGRIITPAGKKLIINALKEAKKIVKKEKVIVQVQKKEVYAEAQKTDNAPREQKPVDKAPAKQEAAE